MILWPPRYWYELCVMLLGTNPLIEQKTPIYHFGGLFRGFVVWMIWIRIKNKNDLNKIRIRLSMNKIFSSIIFQFLETSDSGFEGVRARLCDMKVLKLILILTLILILILFFIYLYGATILFLFRSNCVYFLFLFSSSFFVSWSIIIHSSFRF